jgi:DoxX
MAAFLLACRLVLALIFLVAGLAKLADPVGWRQAAVDFGVPTPLAGTVRWLLPLTEVAVAVALVPSASAPFGAVGGQCCLSVSLRRLPMRSRTAGRPIVIASGRCTVPRPGGARFCVMPVCSWLPGLWRSAVGVMPARAQRTG